MVTILKRYNFYSTLAKDIYTCLFLRVDSKFYSDTTFTRALVMVKMFAYYLQYKNNKLLFIATVTSYSCNDPVSQSECSGLTFMRNWALFIFFLFVKIRAFWLMEKFEVLWCKEIEYQRLFYWQVLLER